MKFEYYEKKSFLYKKINAEYMMVKQLNDAEYEIYFRSSKDCECRLNISSDIYNSFSISSNRFFDIHHCKKENDICFSNGKIALSFSLREGEEISFYILGFKEKLVKSQQIGNVDEFIDFGSFYKCRGWLTDSVYDVKRHYVRFETKNHKVLKEIPVHSIRRIDVQKELNEDRYLFSGFEFKCKIKTTQPVYVFACYYTIKGFEKMLISVIDSNSDQDEIELLEGKCEASMETCEDIKRIGYSTKEIYSLMKGKICILKHSLGGGAEYFIDKKIKEFKNKEDLYIVDYIPNRHQFRLQIENQIYYFEHLDWFFRAVENTLEEIWINELVSYPDVIGTLKKLQDFSKKKQVKMIMYFHDFFSLCPQINLLNDEGNYCGLPTISRCQQCIEKSIAEETSTITEWRQEWFSVLSLCEKIICFSNNSKTFLKNIYPDLDDKCIDIQPHGIDEIGKADINPDDVFTIGLLGVLSHHKGLDKILEFIHYLESMDIDNVRIVLIGYSEQPIESKLFIETGPYTKCDILKYTEEYGIDCFFMSSICPETFSYTLSEMISMDIPVVSFDIGAQGERTKNYGKGKVIPLSADSKELMNNIMELCGFRKNIC